MSSNGHYLKDLPFRRRPRGLMLGLGRMPGGGNKRRSSSPLKTLLDTVGLGSIVGDFPYALLPYARTADKRHFWYTQSTDIESTLSRPSAKYDLENSALVTIPTGQLGINGRVEPEATNPLPALFGTWTIGDGDSLAVAAGPTSPLGTASKTLTPKAASQEHTLYVASATDTGQPYMMYVVAKASGYNWLQVAYHTDYCNFNLSDGTFGRSSGVVAKRAIPLGGGWWRCEIEFTSNANFFAQMAVIDSDRVQSAAWTGDGTSGIHVANACLLPTLHTQTTLIPEAATRQADALRLTGLEDLAAAGGLCFTLRVPFNAPSDDLYHIGINGSNSRDNGIFVYTKASDGHLYCELRSGGVSQGTIDLGACSPEVMYSLALGWSADGLVCAINGQEKTATGAVTVPVSLDRIEIGRGISTDYAHGAEVPSVLVMDRVPTFSERSLLSSLTLILYVFALVGLSQGFFVDSVSGSDDNTGFSASAPLKTLGALAAKDGFYPRQYHYLVTGSVWREEYMCANRAGGTVIGLGSGPKPQIFGSAFVNSWTKTVGKTNVYEFATTGMGTGGFVRVWEDDAKFTIADDLVDCDATPGTYWVASHDACEVVYVHPSDSGNPASNGKSYEYTGTREYCINSAVGENPTGWTLHNIWTRRNYNNNGSVRTYYDWVVSNCRMSDGTKHNIYIRPGCYCLDSECDEAYYGGQGANMWVWNDAEGSLTRGLSFIRCSASTSDGSSGAWFGHLDLPTYTIPHIIYRECEASNVGEIPFGGGNAALIQIIGCSGTFVHATDTYGADCRVEISECDFTLSGGSSSTVNLVARGNSNTTTDIVVRDSTIRWGQFLTNLVLTCDGRNTTFTGCTFKPADSQARSDAALICGVSGTGNTLYLRNNTFDSSNVILSVSGSVTVDSDYNTFKAPLHGSSPFLVDEVAKTLAQWQALGRDVHSVVA